MPKKFLRRHLSKSKNQTEHKHLRWLGPLLNDPYLLHINRHSVSLAFFVGLFTAFLPIPMQTLVAALLALLVRANLPISALLVWITNPVTMTPVLIFSFKLGSWILGTPPVDFHIHLTWEWFIEEGRRIFLPLFLGGFIAGLVAGLLGYLTIQLMWRWTVVRNWQIRRKNRLLPTWKPRNKAAKESEKTTDSE